MSNNLSQKYILSEKVKKNKCIQLPTAKDASLISNIYTRMTNSLIVIIRTQQDLEFCMTTIKIFSAEQKSYEES